MAENQDLRCQVGDLSYLRDEPSEKRQRIESQTSSCFGGDRYASNSAAGTSVSSLINLEPQQDFQPTYGQTSSCLGIDLNASNSAAGIPVLSLVNSEPQWDFQSTYEQTYMYGEPWHFNSHPSYDPIANSGSGFSSSTDFYSAEFEISNSWSVASSYEANEQSFHEQSRWSGLRPDNFTNQTACIETLGAIGNEGDTCFGMIADVPVKSKQSQTLDIDSTCIPVRLCPPYGLFHLEKNEAFAELDERTSKILLSIGQEKGINFQIYCRSVARATFLGKRRIKKGAATGSHLLMNVVVFGPGELCDVVGKYFTKCGIHLQDPQCDRDAVYYNPHILSQSEDIVMISSLAQKNPLVEVESIMNDEDIFSKLCNDDHISLTEAPDAIQTPLYNHQKKALTFMTKREQGWECNGSAEDLWVKEVDENGQLMYTNLITELSQKQEPPDFRGGLLADQMGLGKTLTMISLIALSPSRSMQPIKFVDQESLRYTKTTLIVVPFTLLEIWDTQLTRHLKLGTLKWMRFHGSRKKKVLSISSYDVVITTFETLVRQRKKYMDSKCHDDTLFSYWWHRLVLDEAHIIRNRTTSMAQACCAVHASNRWAITGTPIQNRLTDLGSLVEFLQVSPFSNPKHFDSNIIKPWLNPNTRDISKLKRLINSISLSRTKAIIDLPKREDKIYRLEFSPDEREYYEKQKARTIQQFNDALSSNPPKSGQCLNALQWLNELRLICNHGIGHSKQKHIAAATLGALQASSTWTREIADKAFEAIVCAGDAVCSVCRDDGTGEASSSENSKPTLTSCLNLICGSCIHDVMRGRSFPKCSHIPPCPSREVSWAPEAATSHVVKYFPGIDSTETSTKLKALMKSLCSLSGEKSVVFSYWTYTLDLVGALLQEAGILYTRIDGRLSGESRDQANYKFQNDASLLVILVSITCGGAGLDLTAASRAYLLEPQWNPQMEEQALSRIHRLGQTKEVQTIRYRMRNSFEEKVVKTQDEKKDLAAKVFSDERHHRSRDATLRLKDLKEGLLDYPG